MASIHRQRGRPHWFCAFSEFDPQTNRPKRVFRSTRTSDRKQAMEICRAWQKAALLARNGKLSDRAAHRAPAAATTRRVLGITAGERQPKRFHFPARSERETHSLVVE